MKTLADLCSALTLLTLVFVGCGKGDLNAPISSSHDSVDVQLSKTSSPTATGAGFDVSLFAFGFSSPQGMAFDRRGRLFVADQGTGEIKRVIPGDNSGVSPFAFGLDRPIHIAFKGRDLFTTELGSNEVTMVRPGDNTATTPLISGLNGPTYLAFQGNFLFVNELRGAVDERVTRHLIRNGVAVNSETIITYPNAANNNPEEMLLRGSRWFVSEQITGVIKAFNVTANNIPIDAGTVSPLTTGLSNPGGLAFDDQVRKLYAAGDPDLYEIDTDGTARVIATGFTGTFNDVVVQSNGVLFVSNNGGGEIWKVVRL